MRQELNQNWKMRRLGNDLWQEAIVPGSVYTDLLRNQQIENPFWKDNEDRICAWMEHDYCYECSFSPEEALLSCEGILLRFDGLDTVADLYINGEWLGYADNMHRMWEFDVTKRLQRGDNILMIQFHSPLSYIAEAYKKYGNIGNEDTFEGFMHLRKAHYMFGWDWGAHLPDAGIFRPVSLIGIEKARLDQTFLIQEWKENQVELQCNITINKLLEHTADSYRDEILLEEEKDGLTYGVSLTAPDGSVSLYENCPSKITIEKPERWWPNGLGEQPLYTVEFILYQDGKTIDSRTKRIGLRTISVRREKDEWGESFAHEVNGKTVFAMGADYIPEDHLLGRVSREKTKELLDLCKWANFNTVRVWGGGYYPEDWFFDYCDELGLMVWQDFMFACSVYELTAEFEANIRCEFADNIKRIRHHACLAIWCGNNEMEMFVDQKCWVTKPTEVRDYLLMYERIIPEVLKEYDPVTFYWPASPSSGGSFDNPNDPNRGDVHFWEVWHGSKPFTEYRKHFFRYASEFGFQAFPSIKTLETITDEKQDLNPFSYIIEKHQRNYGSNGKIMNYMQQTFLYPNNFELFVYASQLLQGEAIRYGVEHFRRNRGRCMGAVYWQLNDCWPVISWSSIDYCHRLKALHYYAKRFFAPIMISCEEQGMMSAEANMNRQHFVFEKSIRLNIANETRQEETLQVAWALRNPDASVIKEETKEIKVPALTSIWMDKVEFTDAEIDIFSNYVSYAVFKEGEEISSGTVLFSYPKYFRYLDPQIVCERKGQELVIRANAYAKSVEIQNEAEDLLLSDNYFDMNGGDKTITILKGDSSNLRIRSVYDIK